MGDSDHAPLCMVTAQPSRAVTDSAGPQCRHLSCGVSALFVRAMDSPIGFNSRGTRPAIRCRSARVLFGCRFEWGKQLRLDVNELEDAGVSLAVVDAVHGPLRPHAGVHIGRSVSVDARTHEHTNRLYRFRAFYSRSSSERQVHCTSAARSSRSQSCSTGSLLRCATWPPWSWYVSAYGFPLTRRQAFLPTGTAQSERMLSLCFALFVALVPGGSAPAALHSSLCAAVTYVFDGVLFVSRTRSRGADDLRQARSDCVMPSSFLTRIQIRCSRRWRSAKLPYCPCRQDFTVRYARTGNRRSYALACSESSLASRAREERFKSGAYVHHRLVPELRAVSDVCLTTIAIQRAHGGVPHACVRRQFRNNPHVCTL